MAARRLLALFSAQGPLPQCLLRPRVPVALLLYFLPMYLCGSNRLLLCLFVVRFWPLVFFVFFVFPVFAVSAPLCTPQSLPCIRPTNSPMLCRSASILDAGFKGFASGPPGEALERSTWTLLEARRDARRGQGQKPKAARERQRGAFLVSGRKMANEDGKNGIKGPQRLGSSLVLWSSLVAQTRALASS